MKKLSEGRKNKYFFKDILNESVTLSPLCYSTVNSRFKKDLNWQIHLNKTFLLEYRILDPIEKYFLNQTWLDLWKEKWSSLNQGLPAIKVRRIPVIDTVQDFLIKLVIKLLMYLLKINSFSLNNDIVRITKIMKRADKNLAHF